MRLDEMAETLFAEIRINHNDIAQIARNTGLTEEIIRKIKDHVFYEEHILWSGIKRFDGDLDMANAWKRNL